MSVNPIAKNIQDITDTVILRHCIFKLAPIVKTIPKVSANKHYTLSQM